MMQKSNIHYLFDLLGSVSVQMKEEMKNSEESRSVLSLLTTYWNTVGDTEEEMISLLECMNLVAGVWINQSVCYCLDS